MTPGTFDLAASRTAAAAIGHVLGQAAWARARLEPHAGRTLRVLAGPVAVAFTVTAEGLLQAAASGAAAAPGLVARIPPHALPGIALRDPAAWRAVVFEGDSAFAGDVAFLAEHLRWDAEEDLSRVVGDIAAHRMASVARAVARWPRDTFENLARSCAAYWTEEQPLIARRGDVAAFNHAVDELRDGVARLEARLAGLRSAGHRR